MRPAARVSLLSSVLCAALAWTAPGGWAADPPPIQPGRPPLKFAPGSATPAAAAGPPVAAAPAASATETLRQYVERSHGRYAYGLYLGKKKAGWSIDDSRLGAYEGREVALVESEGRMDMVIRGQKSSYRWRNQTIYELTGDGPAVRIEETTTEDDRTTTTTATRDGDRLRILRQGPGGKTERRMPLPKENLALVRRLDGWLAAVAKPGETFRTYSTSLDDAEIDKPQVYTFLSRRPLRWGGVPTHLTHVRMVSDGASYELDLLDDGAAVKGRIGPFEMRLEEEATAKNLEAAVFDMTFEVPLDRVLGDPRRVESLTLEFRGLGDFHFPSGSGQQVRELDDGTTVMTITRGRRADRPRPLSEAQRVLNTRSTPAIQSDATEIRRLAETILGTEQDPLKKAEQIKRWVHEHLRQTYRANASTALEVLANRAGDCTEHTLLFVALARAAGLPAREVGGLVYDESAVVQAAGADAPARRPTFGWHAWAEVHDGTQWVSIDPTWNETFVDATHVILSIGTDDFAWINVLGQLEVKVREFKTSRPPRRQKR